MAVEIVNVVGAGQLHIELDLEQLANDLDVYSARYNPENYPGIHIQILEDGPTITLYRNGKYHITGPDSVDQLHRVRKQFLNALNSLKIQYSTDQDAFSVQNLVCMADHDASFDLNDLAIRLGLEYVEYEPEQFPGLVYRVADLPVVFLIFASGKIVITGVKSIDEARDAYTDFKETIDSLYSDST
jgi:transcription initiation factor TFIID TATA-box-binding protein